MLTNQKTLRSTAQGEVGYSQVFIAEDAVPGSSPTDTDISEHAFPFVEVGYPGYVDEEVDLSFYNYSPESDRDGCSQIAQVSLNKKELDSLICDLQYVRSLMDQSV